MLARPRLAQLVAACVVAPLLGVIAAGAASAHGAPADPASRAFACGSVGQARSTAACKAAQRGDQGEWFAQWDNIRVANVAGRDREKIPDGELCSGGIDGFGGLNLARADWPATKLKPGQALTVSYRATIPHNGSFRMYLTKNGYDPTKPLRWANLATKPFLTATDPHFDGKAYSFQGTVPTGRTGRQLIYTIWQNTSTADTYYSCSDVVFPQAKSASTVAKASKSVIGTAVTSKPKPRPTPGPSATKAASTPAPGSLNDVTALAATTHANDGPVPRPALAAAAVLALAALAGGVLFTRARRRPPLKEGSA